MWTTFKRTALLVVLGLSQAGAQDLLVEPVELWTNQIIPNDPDNSPAVLYGNGVFLTPDGKHVISSSVGGILSSFDAWTGAFEWEYDPLSAVDGIVRTHSSVVFSTDNAMEPYMVYSIVDNENSSDARTRVVALDMSGRELWISGMLEGIASGSPVVSDDGDYIFLTHNSNFETIGYFSALWAAQNGTLLYSKNNETSPFGPPGIFHSPAVGYYDGDNGVGNTNDLIMWTVQPKPDATNIEKGAIFGFQFPVAFNSNSTSDDVGYFLMGDMQRDFMGITRPVMTNEGRSSYWSVSRSGYYAWVGEEGLDRFHFNRFPTAVEGFTRNLEFPGQPCFAAPALSSDTAAPVIFGGSADDEFVRLSFDFAMKTVVATGSHIMAEAKVDPADRAVYYAESDGIVHQASFADISDNWVHSLGFGVEGEIAISKKGQIIYVADTRGFITALQVAEIPVTLMPSASPSTSPSMNPTGPTVAPADGTPAPTASPTMRPTVPLSATPGPTPEKASSGTPEPTLDTPAPTDSAAAQSLLVTFAAIAACLLI